MTKKPKPPHPLVTVRKSTPHQTQRQFAEFIGVTEIAIRKIESGSLALSKSLAERITRATGVDPATISDPKCATPMSLITGAPYSGVAFVHWSSAFANDKVNVPRTIIEHAEAIKEVVEEILFASVHGRHRKFEPVLWAICQGLAEVAGAFNLHTAIASVRCGDAGPENHQHYEQLKAATFLFRSLGKIDPADNVPLPQDTDDIDFGSVLDDGITREEREIRYANERRVQALEKVRTFTGGIDQPKPPARRSKAGSPKTPQQSSASPKRGNARIVSASRPGAPSR